MNFIRSVGGENPRLYSISRQYYAVSAEHSGEIRYGFRPSAPERAPSVFCRRAVGVDCCRLRAVRRHGFGFAGLYAVVEIQIRRYFGLYGRGFVVARTGSGVGGDSVCQQRGRCDDQRNRFDENDRTARSDERDGGKPCRPCSCAALLGGRVFHAASGFDFQRGGHFRRVFGRCNLVGLGQRYFFGRKCRTTSRSITM